MTYCGFGTHRDIFYEHLQFLYAKIWIDIMDYGSMKSDIVTFKMYFIVKKFVLLFYHSKYIINSR